MKLAPLLSAFAVFAVAILAVGLRTQADPAVASAKDGVSLPQDAPQQSLDAFVAEVGLDVSIMRTTLWREQFAAGGKPSIPFCSLSPKRQTTQITPLDAFAEKVGVNPPDLSPIEGE